MAAGGTGSGGGPGGEGGAGGAVSAGGAGGAVGAGFVGTGGMLAHDVVCVLSISRSGFIPDTLAKKKNVKTDLQKKN